MHYILLEQNVIPINPKLEARFEWNEWNVLPVIESSLLNKSFKIVHASRQNLKWFW